jgi:hypothetical protein
MELGGLTFILSCIYSGEVLMRLFVKNYYLSVKRYLCDTSIQDQGVWCILIWIYTDLLV